MNNPIVYTCTGRRQPPYIDRSESTSAFENRRRVSDGKHQIAKAALRAEYQRKAVAVGMSLAAYCARFNIRLYD